MVKQANDGIPNVIWYAFSLKLAHSDRRFANSFGIR